MTYGRTLASVGTIKPRPECRQFIIQEKLLPDVIRIGNKLFWDAMSARDTTGQRRLFGVGTANGLHLELKRLAASGFFGDLQNVILSWHKYSQLRALLDQGKNRGAFVDVALWQPTSRGTRRTTLKRKR